ncbi:NUDIX domain-containing protein [Paenibacillus sp. FJAT-26967]|uniref:NUDIX domain-containing protein n=1 Tax=Paenibacillus sp. FJAT-26967 TaxID=1729690 RepID=UPI000837BA30|nr:NUDIX hydrolase [Paenibacillus sp. FJAT-26967]
MITLRLISAALLFNSRGDLLMMKRSMNRTLSPGMWAAVGGHLEACEMALPRAACLREIEEETGIAGHEISGLRLQYILMRLKEQEIRQQFIYVGQTDITPRITTAEGDLHWIPHHEIMNRNLPFIFQFALDHYLVHGDTPHPWVGTSTRDKNGDPSVSWTPLLDPNLV